MIALIWGSVAYHLDVERTRARQSAVQNTGNLARSFEEYTARSRKEIDKSLLLLRTAFEKNPEHPNWQWQSMMSNDRAKDEINPSASMRTNRAPS